MKKIQINCDNCERDLTENGPVEHYRLCLFAEKMHNPCGYVVDVLIYPPIDSVKHFCGLGCLKKWLETRGKS